MNILDEIVVHKRREVAARKERYAVSNLEQTIFFSAPVCSMVEHIRRPGRTGIIAEIKRKSPSKGVIHPNVNVKKISVEYVAAGASALSVLTDESFFGGTTLDLMEARKANVCPILRKDFTIDEYQIVEARSIGADAILLIAAILTPTQSRAFASLAHSLGMEVLLEVHNEQELHEHENCGADLIGVNNRNLKTFEVDIDLSRKLAPLIPPSVVKVSESGLSAAQTLVDLRAEGYEGFLMGENFMKHESPGDAAKLFMDQLRSFQAIR